MGGYSSSQFDEDKSENVTESGKESETTWRNFEPEGDWNEEYADKLFKDITEHEIKDTEVKNIRVLLLGPIKAGKSSFINTVASIDKGHISQITNAGGTGTSLTSKFNPASSINEKAKEFIEKPVESQEVHCVVYVMDANVVGEENVREATKKKVHALQEELKCFDIPSVVLLTKIDVLCDDVDRDITSVFRSVKVKKAVEKAKQLFALPGQNVFPVQNYEDAVQLDPKKDILTLLALRQMIRFGADSLEADHANTAEQMTPCSGGETN